MSVHVARRELLMGLLSIATSSAVIAASGQTADAPAHDFDFLMGKWSVKHRRLRTRLTGDTHWESFAGSCEAFPILGGVGNVDDNVLELPGGTYTAASIRVFDPSRNLWSIWWIDSRTGTIAPPVRGSFQSRTGTFYGDDELRGKPVRARFIWSDITERSAQWQQAFSNDSGISWETNWFMEFLRRA